MKFNMGTEFYEKEAAQLRRRTTLHDFRKELQRSSVERPRLTRGVADRMLAIFIRAINNTLLHDEPVSQHMEASVYLMRDLFEEAFEDGAPTDWEEVAQEPVSRKKKEAT